MMNLRLWTIVCGFLAAATTASAQQAGNAAIRGVVVDQQQGVLPGVTVVATHQESGVFRETVSGADGSFILVALVPGPYTVTADLSGFKKLTRRDVILAIGTTQTLELKLEVGGLTEDVTVTANAALVDFTSAQVAANVSGGELKDLPSINRDFVGFVALLPGAS